MITGLLLLLLCAARLLLLLKLPRGDLLLALGFELLALGVFAGLTGGLLLERLNRHGVARHLLAVALLALLAGERLLAGAALAREATSFGLLVGGFGRRTSGVCGGAATTKVRVIPRL